MQAKSKSSKMRNRASSDQFCAPSHFGLKFDWVRELMTAGIVAAWITILTQVALLASEGSVDTFGLGMNLLGQLHLDLLDAGGRFGALVLSLCAPSESQTLPQALLTAFIMWMLMVFAMMVPGVMSSYDPNKSHSKPPSQMVLFSFGFVLIWSVASFGAASSQVALQELGYLTDSFVIQDWRLGLAAILFAIYYPLSATGRYNNLQCNAFLRRMNNSKSMEQPFYAGLNMGAKCIHCCWPMMLAMFAFGVMNVFAMAAFTIVLMFQRRQKNRLVAD